MPIACYPWRAVDGNCRGRTDVLGDGRSGCPSPVTRGQLWAETAGERTMSLVMGVVDAHRLLPVDSCERKLQGADYVLGDGPSGCPSSVTRG
jgi:hypothetical protein